MPLPQLWPPSSTNSHQSKLLPGGATGAPREPRFRGFTYVSHLVDARQRTRVSIVLQFVAFSRLDYPIYLDFCGIFHLVMSIRILSSLLLYLRVYLYVKRKGKFTEVRTFSLSSFVRPLTFCCLFHRPEMRFGRHLHAIASSRPPYCYFSQYLTF